MDEDELDIIILRRTRALGLGAVITGGPVDTC